MDEREHVTSTRAAYDATADLYAEGVGVEISPATEAAMDRALLTAFVELVGAGSRGLVADVGCGPGRVAALLAAHGIDVLGVDASLAMLTLARSAHPDVPSTQGLLDALPVRERSLAGVVCWYSIIHTPPRHLPPVGAELRRVLVPGGHVLLAFQSGAGERVHRAEVRGRHAPLTSYRHDADEVERVLAQAGLHVHARARRRAELAHESSPQAFVLARAPAQR